MTHFTPVVCFIPDANETHHGCIICKLSEEVGPLSGCEVAGQQNKKEGAQQTYLGGPCVQSDGAGCVTSDPYCLQLPCQGVQ